MIDKTTLLNYLKNEIKSLEQTYENFAWMDYIKRGILEKISLLEEITELIKSGKFDVEKT